MKMKQLIAGVLAAVMVVGSIPDAGHGGIEAQAAEARAWYTYTEVGDSVYQTMEQMARSNSEQIPAAGNDGSAADAFDRDPSNWWHTRYQWNYTAGDNKHETENMLAHETVTSAQGDSQITEKNIWIGTGFGEKVENISKITVKPRGSHGDNIKGYKLYIANVDVDKAVEEITADEWGDAVTEGTFTEGDGYKPIVFEPKTATHFKIEVVSSKDERAKYTNASDIRVYTRNDGQDPTENIALGKTAVASSEETATFTALKAVDGNRTENASRWSSKEGIVDENNQDPHWIYVDLGEPATIQTVRLYWQQRKATAYEIQTSDDAQNWTTRVTRGMPASKTDIIQLEAPVTARYVKVNITGNQHEDPDGGVAWSSVSIFEFEVYGGMLEVNKTDLAAKITEVAALIEETYTRDSWEALRTKLVDANTVNENASATQTEVDTALAALREAQQALIERATGEEIKALQTQLNEAKTLNSEDYSEAGQEALEADLTEAEALTSHPENAAKADVTALTAEMRVLIQSLKGGVYVPGSLDIIAAKDSSHSWGATKLAWDKNIENKSDNWWHTAAETAEDNKYGWIQFELDDIYWVNELRYLPRLDSSSNGRVKKYEIWAGMTEESMKMVATNAEGDAWSTTGENRNAWKIAKFEAVQAKYVKFVGVECDSDSGDKFTSATEIIILGSTEKPDEAITVDVSAELPQAGANLDEAKYSPTAEENANYTVTTQWTNASGAKATTAEAGQLYTMTATYKAKDGYKFTDDSAAQMTWTSNGISSTATPTVEVSEDGKTMTVSYTVPAVKLEFMGGSLRKRSDGYDKADLRFGYQIYDLEENSDWTLGKWGWQCGTAPDDKRTQEAKSWIDKDGYIVSNLVFTNISDGHYQDSVYAKLCVEYKKGADTIYAVVPQESRSVSEIVEKIFLGNPAIMEKLLKEGKITRENGNDNWASMDHPETLVDGNEGADGLFKFSGSWAADEPAPAIVMTFNEPQVMEGFRIAFENLGSQTDSLNYQYKYHIEIQKVGSDEFIRIEATSESGGKTANRTNNRMHELWLNEEEMGAIQAIKIVMDDCTCDASTNNGRGYPAIAEFGIYDAKDDFDYATDLKGGMTAI